MSTSCGSHQWPLSQPPTLTLALTLTLTLTLSAPDMAESNPVQSSQIANWDAHFEAGYPLPLDEVRAPLLPDGLDGTGHGGAGLGWAGLGWT